MHIVFAPSYGFYDKRKAPVGVIRINGGMCFEMLARPCAMHASLEFMFFHRRTFALGNGEPLRVCMKLHCPFSLRLKSR